MRNASLSFLSHDAAGLALAAVPALAGLATLSIGRTASPWVRLLGGAALGAGAALAYGSARHLNHMAQIRAKYPPLGKLVDVGGYRVHVLAEGDARGKPAVVWMPGGHASGLHLYHLHCALREEARSILIDRPGTGWSDSGPFPRTTVGEVREVVTALEKAGERGPFVFVGYSFGGLLVANIARRMPELVAALVLFDATPPDTIIYGPRHPLLHQSYYEIVKTALSRLFGFYEKPPAAPPKADEVNESREDVLDRLLGPALTTLQAIESGPRAALAYASIREELSPVGLAKVGWDTVVYDGDLGDMPVFLVAPGELTEEEFQQIWVFLAEEAKAWRPGELEERARRIYRHTRERYRASSSNCERIYTPPGTTHFFAYEVPEFVADVVGKIVASARQAPAEPGTE